MKFFAASRTFLSYLTLLALFVTLQACGGGGGGDSTPAADVTAPVITLNGANTITLVQGDAYVEAGATATDNTDGTVTVTISGTVDTNAVGSYTVRYSATDAANNSTEATRTINVMLPADTTAPVITPTGTNVVNIEVNTIYVDAGATALDNIDGDITANITTTSTVNTSTAGSYSVRYDISDAAGNSAIAIRIVNIISFNMNNPVRTITPAIDGSGDVYVGGQFTAANGISSNRLVRMNSDGTVDTSFNIGTGMNDAISSIAPATDGSGDVYVGGSFTTVNGVTYNRLVRMNSDGTVDTGFNIGSGMNNFVRSIVPATDGSGDVYVGGFFTTVNGVTYNRLVRMNSDGTVDTGFNIGTGMNSLVWSIAPATDGNGDVYVGGNFTTVNGVTYNRLVRLNSDGTVDTSFNIGTGMSNSVFRVTLATDGSGDVYVGGGFTSINGTTYNYLARINSDGTVDTSFNIDSGVNVSVISIAPAIDASGDIYVGGNFTSVNGITYNRLVRMNSDGTVDTDFNIGTGMRNSVWSIAPVIDGSGDVYVGGDFTTVNGGGSSYFAQIKSDGTVK